MEVLKLLNEKAVHDEHGWTALHSAAWWGYWQVVHVLLRALSNPPHTISSQNIAVSEHSQNDRMNAIDLLGSLVLKYPSDSTLWRALGNEYIRRKKYKEVSVAFDISMYITMKEMKTTRVEDISTDVMCDECGQLLRGCHYKCVRCGWNHDMCEVCLTNLNHSHPFADFNNIPSKEFTVDGVGPYINTAFMFV